MNKAKNIKEMSFVTNNSYKFKIAEDILVSGGFRLIQKKINTPEIQDESVEKIASFSAKWASETLTTSAVVSDGGCYIEALGGFPGPFIKYINHWLKADDLLAIMRDKKNRRVLWTDCLAYCEPGKKPVTFASNYKGRLAEKTGANLYRKKYGWIDTLFIPEGFTMPLSELPTKTYLQFWSEHNNGWKKLIHYLNALNK